MAYEDPFNFGGANNVQNAFPSTTSVSSTSKMPTIASISGQNAGAMAGQTANTFNDDIVAAMTNPETSEAAISQIMAETGAKTPEEAFKIMGMTTGEFANLAGGGIGILSGLWNIKQGKEMLDIMKSQEGRAENAYSRDVARQDNLSSLNF